MEFFLEYYDFFKLVFELLFLLVLVLFRGKYFSKKEINQILEVISEMKNRLPSYREKDKAIGTSFDTEVTQYRKNKQTGLLEELPDKLDLQALTNSTRETALSSILQRLDPVLSSEDKLVSEADDLMDKLDVLRSADDYRRDLCERYSLDPVTSLDDVLAHLKAEKSLVDSQIELLRTSKKSEVIGSEEQKTLVEEGK